MVRYLPAFCLLLTLLAPRAGRAADLTWSGPANGDWFTTTNWVPTNNYPQAGDTVAITSGSVRLTGATERLASFTLTNAALICSNWSTTLSATNMEIFNGGTITVANAFSNGWMSNRVSIICSNLTVNSGGVISVNSKGYYEGEGLGAGSGSASFYYGSGGGGHGGGGGRGATFGGGGTNGSLYAPSLPGSGGGRGRNSRGGAGGGVIRIQADGTVTLNGALTANGAPPTAGNDDDFGGGGAGGSVYVNCRVLAGAGTLTAYGGTGKCSTAYTSSGGGGGGGGRIAVEVTNAAPTAIRFDVSSGTGYYTDKTDLNAAQMGTLYLSATNILSDIWGGQIKGGFLIAPGFDSWPGSVTISNTVIGFANFTFSETPLIETNSGLFLDNALELSVAGDYELKAGALFRLGAGSAFACRNLDLRNNAKFRLLDGVVGGTNLICDGAIVLGTNAALTLHTNSTLIGASNIVLDTRAALNLHVNSTLICARDIVLGGTNAALALAANSTLNCADNIALGTNAALTLGTNSTLICGGDLTLDKAQLTMSYYPTLNIGGDLLLTNSAGFSVYGGPTNESNPLDGGRVGVTGAVTLVSSSWIYPYSASNGGFVSFKIGGLMIGATAGFNANAKGYNYGLGPGAGSGSANIYGSGGGGHGGKGGTGTSYGGGITNGSPLAPVVPGSAGGRARNAYALGGGVIRIDTDGAITLNGALTANGGAPGGATDEAGGGGAGGAIYVSCPAFSGGAGSVLSVCGGNGRLSTTPSDRGGGGGGGRIAIWIDVARSMRERYVLAGGGRAVLASTNWPDFNGLLSTANGTGNINPPTNGCPESGTCFFFKYVKGTTLKMH